MKPTSFDYVRAETLSDVFAVLAAHGDNARILAGGQSLIPAMAMRLAVPEILIDIAGLADLRRLEVVDGRLRIGALCRHAELLDAVEVEEHAPLIARALPHIAHPAIRNRGTIGGSLCHADPAAELPACALALDASFDIQGPSGQRTVTALEFFQGIYSTNLRKDEILLSIDVPMMEPTGLCFFDEFARRQGDYAMAGLAAGAAVEDERLTHVRLAFFAIGATPIRAMKAEQILEGAAIADIDAVADTVSTAIADEIEPFDDLTTSSGAKLAMMQVLARRALAAFVDQGALP
ncbi:MAG: xanthine dehydrogenase family protein subunit M [Alphaproteobacteria bacterium]